MSVKTTAREHNIRERALSDPYKQRAREQWSANPCGANVAEGLEDCSREHFDAIENYRYLVYAPWMKDAIGFDKFRGKRLLEVGCGTGTDLLQFARGGARVTGYDITERSIEIARRRFEIYGLDGDFIVGDGENLCFPDGSFDVVYSFGVIHHTPDTERAANEIRRVLRPGGRMIVMIYHRSSIYYWAGLVLKHGIFGGELFRYSIDEIMSRHVEQTESGGRPLVKAYTRKEARRLFRGFSDVKIEVNQLRRKELRLLGRLIPESMFQWLARHFGWNLIITATR